MRRRLSASVAAGILPGLLVLGGCTDDQPGAAPVPAHTTGSPTATPTPYGQYVAIGDSYTAAPLVPPTDRSTICFRSGVNYPALVTEAMPGTQLSDVSCSGATTANTVTAQREFGAVVPPQFGALRKGTDLVTVGLGGNDESLFSLVMVECTRLASTDPGGSPCADRLSGTVGPILTTIRSNLVRVARGVERRSPHARVLLVGYPQIVPASGTCRDLPLATGDYPFVRGVNERLDQAVRSAAHDAGVEYVDTWTPTAGHDICAADPWINGRVTSAKTALAYHPLAVEQRAVAAVILAMLR